MIHQHENLQNLHWNLHSNLHWNLRVFISRAVFPIKSRNNANKVNDYIMYPIIYHSFCSSLPDQACPSMLSAAPRQAQKKLTLADTYTNSHTHTNSNTNSYSYSNTDTNSSTNTKPNTAINTIILPERGSI